MNLGVWFSRNAQFQLLFILFPFKILQTAHLESLMRSTKVCYCLKKILSIDTSSLKTVFDCVFIRDGPNKWKEDVPAISESSKQAKYTPVSTNYYHLIFLVPLVSLNLIQQVRLFFCS